MTKAESRLPTTHLVCPSCGTKTFVPKISKKLIGHKCPSCGAVDFTRSDWKTWQRVRAYVIASRVLGVLWPFSKHVYQVEVRDDTLKVQKKK